MLYCNLNIKYDAERILSEIKDLDYQPLVHHYDGRRAPDWLLANLPLNSYTKQVCDNIVADFETQLQTPARALRFSPPQTNQRHADAVLARGVINIVIEPGFKLELEGELYDFRTSIFDVKKIHCLPDIHSTIHLIRMDVVKMYSELLETAKQKNLIL